MSRNTLRIVVATVIFLLSLSPLAFGAMVTGDIGVFASWPAALSTSAIMASLGVLVGFAAKLEERTEA